MESWSNRNLSPLSQSVEHASYWSVHGPEIATWKSHSQSKYLPQYMSNNDKNRGQVYYNICENFVIFSIPWLI